MRSFCAWFRSRLCLAVLLVSFSGMVGCQNGPAGGGGGAVGGDPAAGQALYEANNCAGCHGQAGADDPQTAGAADLVALGSLAIQEHLTSGEHSGGSADELGFSSEDYADLEAYFAQVRANMGAEGEGESEGEGEGEGEVVAVGEGEAEEEGEGEEEGADEGENEPPTAEAGESLVVTEGTLAVLDGSLSRDPDGDPLTYSWSQTDGARVDLRNATATKPSFTAPDVEDRTFLRFSLTVNDGEYADQDSVTVEIAEAAALVMSLSADAGPDREVAEGESVTLDGGGSRSVPDGPVTFTWSQTGGPPVELVGAGEAVANFVAPEVDSSTAVEFELKLEQGGQVSRDSVSVQILDLVTPASVICPVQFVVAAEGGEPSEPVEGTRPLTVTCTAVATVGSALPEGTYVWLFDGAEDSGPMSTHSERSHVFTTVGPHTVAFILTLAGGVAPLSCVSSETGANHVEVYVSEPSGGGGSGGGGGGGGGGGSSSPECSADSDCDDGEYCNGAETCNGDGLCQAGDDPCPGEMCRESDDQCVACLAHSDCDDGSFCNGAERCNAGGQCFAGLAPCAGLVCDEDEDVCTGCVADADCDNGQYCDGAETCDGEGVCQDGGAPCPGQLCRESDETCVECLDDTDCYDGLYCTGVETCDANGDCQAGVDPCPGQMCRESDDACVECLADGDCDDGTFCNGTETCDANGDCQGGSEPCTTLACDEDLDACVACEQDSECDDGVYCNGAETCDGTGHCQPGADPCPGQFCRESDDACVECLTDAGCDDGAYCNGVETCDGDGNCQGGTDPCPGQMCRESDNTCVNCLVDGDCSDDLYCSGVETCDANGNCQAGTDPCLGQMCRESDDACVECLADGDCDDGFYCNGVETCDTGGACQPGSNPCGAGEQCIEASDSCVEGVAWTPPVGIPDAEFGIHQEAEDLVPRPDPWDEPTPGYYYVDRYNANATDSSNPYGTPAKPRQTIPSPLNPGDVVELHGTYDYNPGSRILISGSGTLAQPIFIRGQSDANRPLVTRKLFPGGDYQIFENLEMTGDAPFEVLAPRHHIAFRHNLVHGVNTSFGRVRSDLGSDSGDTYVEYVVFYDNEIHELGDWQAAEEHDWNGVIIQRQARYVWVVDNLIYHCQGDSVAVNTSSGSAPNPPQYVYIGRNTMFENQENAVDMKVCYDVVLSQNEMYEFRDTPGADPGYAVVMHDDQAPPGHPYPQRLWLLNNHIHHADGSASASNSDYVYFIGNVVHDIISSVGINENSAFARGHGLQNVGAFHCVMAHNVIYNCDQGISVFSGTEPRITHVFNNIVYDITNSHFEQYGTQGWHMLLDGGTADQCSADHNLFFQTGENIHISWYGFGTFTSLLAYQAGSGQGTGSLAVDPQFVDAAGGDFHVQAMGSPPVDSGVGNGYASTFASAYGGLDIDMDRDGVARPKDGNLNLSSEYDLGAYEYVPGAEAGWPFPTEPGREVRGGCGIFNGITLIGLPLALLGWMSARSRRWTGVGR